MANYWSDIPSWQLKEAPPSKCRYCGEPIYWETLPDNKKRPVDAWDIQPHQCKKRGKY